MLFRLKLNYAQFVFFPIFVGRELLENYFNNQ